MADRRCITPALACGETNAQDEATSVVDGVPREAVLLVIAALGSLGGEHGRSGQV